MTNDDLVQAQSMPAIAGSPVAWERIAGPPATPLLGWTVQAVKWSRDPVGYLTMLYQSYGTFSVWNANRPRRVFAFAPEHNQQLFSNPDLFHITPRTNRNLLPPNSAMLNLRSGLLSLDGDEHRRHRRLMSPAFHHKQVEIYRDAMVEMTGQMLDRWRVDQVREVEADMRRLVHRIAMKAVLSLEDPQDVERLNDVIEDLLSATPRAMLFPFDLPGTSYRRMLRSADRIAGFLRSLIEHKRANPAECQDVLAMLMAARQESNVGLTETELIAEAYSVLCHETSASALVWTLFLLAQHPRVYGDLVDELSGQLRGDAPTIEQLSRLPLLERVIKESLRLLPTAPFGVRFSTESCQFGPCELPKGAAVTFSPYITHRLPEIYDEPQRFLPERWEDGKPTLWEYFPFGAGAHNCIGGTFAMIEMKIVLAMMLQRYRLRLVPNTRIDRVFRLSLRPRNGLPMIVATQDRPLARSPVRGNINEMVDCR